jgi:ABC-type transport system involved in cytochrome bd biosynthesis fused ATPase/permease subunit
VNYHYAQDGTIMNLRRKSMSAYPAFYENYMGELLRYIAQFAGIISIISVLSPLFLFLIAVTSAVSILLIFKTRKNDFDFRNDKVEEERKIDIWDIPNEEYYKIISAVFQDFVNLSFTLKENISMNESGCLNKIAEIIDVVGLKERVAELPDGYETYLSKSFDSDGIEFSGGQAQKIAIARAVYKNTPVLILDEPTANLDPKAESEIYTDFFNIAKDKTTIFISHRLAASTIADNIAVFSDGKITEYGFHDDLIKQDGIYAEMYCKQSRQYVNENSIF